MRMSLASVLSCAAVAVVLSKGAQAQTPAAVVARTVLNAGTPGSAVVTPPCAYVDCALRLEPGRGGRRLVRGTSGQVVGTFGFFHSSAVDSLLAGPDSAAAHAREYTRDRRTARIYSAIGLTTLLSSIVYHSVAHDEFSANLIALGVSYAVAIPAGRHYTRADQHMSRAVWWYNAALADSMSKR